MVPSFDSTIFYPHVVQPSAKYFSRVHPNWITLFNCYVKWLAFCAVLSWSPWALLVWGALERYLDCLDGVVARKFDKRSVFGHWMDKTTDLVYRWASASAGVYVSIPLLAQDAVAPGSLVLVCVGLPALYAYEAYRGNIIGGNTTAASIAIHVEDNATLLVVLLPLMQAWIMARCEI